jgi:hypothetical protein
MQPSLAVAASVGGVDGDYPNDSDNKHSWYVLVMYEVGKLNVGTRALTSALTMITPIAAARMT